MFVARNFAQLAGELLRRDLVEELAELVDDLFLVHLFPFELDRRFLQNPIVGAQAAA